MTTAPQRLILVLALFTFVLGACTEAGPVGADGDEQLRAADPVAAKHAPASKSAIYKADLQPLNDSGVSGTAQIKIQNGRFVAQVNATGVAPDQPHAQHIHGFTDGTVSTCPTFADDADGDGLVSVSEGAPRYGGILVPLDGSLDVAEGLGDLATFPAPSNTAGAYSYRQTETVGSLAGNGGLVFSDLMLENHAIVVHGAFVDGAYRATLPVACGTLSRTN